MKTMNDNEVTTLNQSVTGMNEASMYFWLGADAEAEEVTEEEFNVNIEMHKLAREKFLNVEL